VNTSFSLHKIYSIDECPFNENHYSWFKFGDKFYAQQFAQELFDAFILQFGNEILKQEEIIILPSPYLSIPTASNFLCQYFKTLLNNYLFSNNRKAALESKIYRNQTYVTDYGNLDFEERVKLISNDTYYIDRNFISGKYCILLDDIKITGSHEHTVNKILNQYNVVGNFIFVYFAELINKDIHPKIENHYNYFAVKNLEDIINVVNRATFQYNTRIIKYILNLNEADFTHLLNNIPKDKANDLFHLAISNNYHQIQEYKNNINSIKTN
jgi:PRTase ComF-like